MAREPSLSSNRSTGGRGFVPVGAPMLKSAKITRYKLFKRE
ncbi:hypothetical protein A2U01_0101598, partial [Trifolium medium]|nr:hypothetical protein [Trifolium medium]